MQSAPESSKDYYYILIESVHKLGPDKNVPIV